MNQTPGRTLEAVLHPGHFAPFPGIAGKADFDAAWNEKRPWVLANMAHAAYCDFGADLEALFAGFGAAVKFYRSRPDKTGLIRGREALLAIWPDRAILCFRGTEPDEQLEAKMPSVILAAAAKLGISVPKELGLLLATDILDDLNFRTTAVHGAEIHRGFMVSAMDLWPMISADLSGLRQVHATGHSLGAAMAVVTGMMHEFQSIVTFGEPMVGKNIGAVLKASQPHTRYVNGDDPVTKLPPDFFPFNYQHHGTEIRIVDSAHGGPNALYDHSIVNYAEILA